MLVTLSCLSGQPKSQDIATALAIIVLVLVVVLVVVGCDAF